MTSRAGPCLHIRIHKLYIALLCLIVNLGGGFKYVVFSPLFGEDVQFGVETTNQFRLTNPLNLQTFATKRKQDSPKCCRPLTQGTHWQCTGALVAIGERHACLVDSTPSMLEQTNLWLLARNPSLFFYLPDGTRT